MGLDMLRPVGRETKKDVGYCEIEHPLVFELVPSQAIY